jgi:hypothetical protein
MLQDLMSAGVSYAAVRDDIAPGDLLLLHHEFVASWYGVQIEAVQRATGFFAHIAVFDRVIVSGRERLVVYESVVPHLRSVFVSATAEEGFFWISMAKPMAQAESDAWWVEFGAHPFLYDKVGAIEAGECFLRGVPMPLEEDTHPRRWCAKAVGLHRLKSGVDLGRSYIPTEMANVAQNLGGVLRYVRMQ